MQNRTGNNMNATPHKNSWPCKADMYKCMSQANLNKEHAEHTKTCPSRKQQQGDFLSFFLSFWSGEVSGPQNSSQPACGGTGFFNLRRSHALINEKFSMRSSHDIMAFSNKERIGDISMALQAATFGIHTSSCHLLEIAFCVLKQVLDTNAKLAGLAKRTAHKCLAP